MYKKYHSDFAPELLLKSKAVYSESRLNASQRIFPVDSASKTEDKVDSIYSHKNAYPLNLNTATQVELEKLPSIGPVLAKRIIDYRKQNGGFKKIEEIQKVQGIGKKIFEAIKNRIAVN